MLTRRIGLEPVVLQHPAPSRVPAPSEQGTMRDETGAGSFSTAWEQPVDRRSSRGSKGPCSVRRAGSGGSPGSPQYGRHLGCGRALSPSRGWAGSGPRGFAPRASRARGRGGFETGRESVRQGARAPGSAGLSSRRLREPTTEGVRAARIGITASPPRSPHGLSSCLVACPAKADLDLIRWSSIDWPPRGRRGVSLGVREGCQPPGHGPAGLAPSVHHLVELHLHRSMSRGQPWGVSIGVRADPGLCSWIVEIAEVGGAAPLHPARACKRSRASKRSSPAMEGALVRGRSSSLTRRRAKSILVPPRRGSHIPSRGGATEGVRGRIQTLVSGRQRRDAQGARSKRPRPRAHQVRAMLVPSGRNPRVILDPCRSWRLAVKRGSTRSCPVKVSAGRAAWKLASPAKAWWRG
jgi:hypothetical protein